MASSRVTALLCLFAAGWIAGAATYSYPAVKRELDEKRFLAHVNETHPPVIPVECARARGAQNQDFIREDKNPDRCWVDLASFRRLYPEVAAITDEAASAQANLQTDLPLENWDGSAGEELLRGAMLCLSLPLLLAIGALGLSMRTRLRRFGVALWAWSGRPAEAL